MLLFKINLAETRNLSLKLNVEGLPIYININQNITTFFLKKIFMKSVKLRKKKKKKKLDPQVYKQGTVIL